jgi:import inner membrane translocase subunit TIM23
MSDSSKRPNLLPDISGIDFSKIGQGQQQRSKSDPDYIINNTKGRDIMPRLFFNTGVFWLGGFTAGGLYGMQDGWRNAPSPSIKIRINSILNGVSKHGSNLGNNLGVLVFLHTGLTYIADEVLTLDRVSGFEASIPLASGFVTGALFNHARGPRAAVLSGVIGCGLSAAHWFGWPWVYSTVLGKGRRY